MDDWLPSSFQGSPGTRTDSMPLVESIFEERLLFMPQTNKQAHTRYRKNSLVSALGTTGSKAERIKAISSESHREGEGTETHGVSCGQRRGRGGRRAGWCWATSMSAQYRNTSQGKRADSPYASSGKGNAFSQGKRPERCGVLPEEGLHRAARPSTPGPHSSSDVSHFIPVIP